MKKSRNNNHVDSRIVRQINRRVPTIEQLESWITDKRLSDWLFKKTNINCDNTLQTLYQRVLRDNCHDHHVTCLEDPGKLIVSINVLNWTLWYAQSKVILGAEVKVVEDWQYDVWGNKIGVAPIYLQQ